MKYIKPLVVLTVLLAAAAVVFLMRKSTAPVAERAGITTDIPVSVTVVAKHKLTSNISLAGTINANNDVNVISETQGSVRRIHFKVGDHVKAGTLLAAVEDDIPRSNLATAEISAQKARRDYERAEALFQENSTSRAQLDAARLAMQAADNGLDIARRQLGNTAIKSSIAGTVNARFVNVGTMVQPGMPIANIVDITTLIVRVNVSKSEAFQLTTGDPVSIATNVYPGQSFPGRIENIASKADEAHTYPVEITMHNNATFPLKAGMFCRISFTSMAATEAISIPRSTLVGSVKSPSVFLVRQGNARQQQIVVGKQTNEYLEVLQGLSEGDTVVTSGQNNLTDRAKVLIVSFE